MKSGTVWVARLETTAVPSSCKLVCELRSGVVAPGMAIEIPLNRSTYMTASIVRIEDGPLPNQVSLFVSCADPEEAQLLAALDLRDEEIDCYEQ
jgi:hypothetical protein